MSSTLSPRETKLVEIRAATEEELQLRFTTVRNFISETKPDYQWYHHCVVLASVLDRVERGELKRVMIFEPPQNGKTELTSRQFPAYCLNKNPERKVILTSYAADHARRISRDARDNYTKTGSELRDDASAVHDWMTAYGGGMLSAGVGGPITGSGGDIIIIDDPVKNSEEAYSTLVQENQWLWYKTTLYTRRRPNAAIILIMTRWVTDDLAGRLLALEAQTYKTEPEKCQNWHIVSFEAEKLAGLLEIPKSCTLEPDWRKPGDALCPEMFPKEDLEITKALDETTWWAMHQQRPMREGGNLWKLEWFKKFDDTRNGVKLYDDGCDWDMNDGGDRHDSENAACAYVRSSMGTDGNIYVTDCGFQWLGFPEQLEWMKSIESPHYIENKAAGRSATTSLQKAGNFAMEVKVKGLDKVSRTILATPVAKQGKIFIHVKVWEKLLLDDKQGILGFPTKPFKDLNDAFVQMVNRRWPFTESIKPKPKGNTRTVEELSSREYVQENIFQRALAKNREKKTNSVTL